MGGRECLARLVPPDLRIDEDAVEIEDDRLDQRAGPRVGRAERAADARPPLAAVDRAAGFVAPAPGLRPAAAPARADDLPFFSISGGILRPSIAAITRSANAATGLAEPGRGSRRE